MHGNRLSGTHRRTWRRLAAAALCTLALAGCATGGLKPDAPLPAEQGLLVVRIVSNADEPERWDWLEIWSVERQKLHSLTPLERVGDASAVLVSARVESTTMFAGPLPPGQYRLDAVRSTKTLGTIVQTTTAPLHGPLGTFRIQAGRVTNLGTVIHQPELNSNAAQKYLVTQVTAEAELTALLKQRFPVIAAEVLKKPVLGFEAIPDAERKVVILRLARATSAHVNDPREAPWGEVVAGSLLGQVLVRSADGRWRSLDTGYTGEITTVLALKSGDLLAAGEEGLLLLSADRGRTWSRLPAPDAGIVEDVDQAEDGQCYLLMRNGSGYGIYRTADPRADSWQRIRPMDRMVGVGAVVSSRAALLLKPSVAIALPPEQFAWHDPATGEWHSVQTGRFTMKEPRLFTRMRVRADGLLYGPAAGRLAKAHGQRGIVASRDGGKSWEALTTFDESSGVRDVLFTSATAGYALVYRKGVEGHLVMATADGGKSWEERGRLSAPANALFTADAGRVLLASSGHGAVWASRDLGKSWSLERALAFR